MDAIEVDYLGEWLFAVRRRPVQRWPLLECTMRPVLVVMRGIRGEHMLEVAAADDQDPVEALAADAADPKLGVRPCLRRPHGCLDHPHAFGAEDFVEVTGELAVSITDEEPRANIFFVEGHQ